MPLFEVVLYSLLSYENYFKGFIVEEKYILKLDNEFYDGLYSGSVCSCGQSKAKVFDSKESIFKELQSLEWIILDIREQFKNIEIINIIVFTE